MIPDNPACLQREPSKASPSSAPRIEIGLGRVDPLQRPVKRTVYNASLVNCHIDMDTTNRNMPVSGACNGSSWATAGFVRASS